MSVKKIYNADFPEPFPIRNLRLLGIAIRRVTNDYCVWENNNQLQQKGERVFAYELYYQFKRLLNGVNNINLRLDGEIDKNFNENMDYCGVEENLLRLRNDRYLRNQTKFSPDLVLHLAQNDRMQNNQSLIIEIKTKKVRNGELAKDLVKLNHYIWRLNFQYAVFISVNTNFNELKRQIRNIFINQAGWNERFNQIVIFNYNNEILQVNTLQNVLEE